MFTQQVSGCQKEEDPLLLLSILLTRLRVKLLWLQLQTAVFENVTRSTA